MLRRPPPRRSSNSGSWSDRSERRNSRRFSSVRALAAARTAWLHCGDEPACARRARGARRPEKHIDHVAGSPHRELERRGRRPRRERRRTLDGGLREHQARRTRIVGGARRHGDVGTKARDPVHRVPQQIAAAIAEKIDGLVYDQLLGRIDGARDFAPGPHGDHPRWTLRHSAEEPHRGVLYEPKAPGIVRILTAGLSRWGAPDVEGRRRTHGLGQPYIADIVLGVAEALANGATSGPVTLGRDDFAARSRRALPRRSRTPRGDPDRDRPWRPVPPEGGDPNAISSRASSRRAAPGPGLPRSGRALLRDPPSRPRPTRRRFERVRPRTSPARTPGGARAMVGVGLRRVDLLVQARARNRGRRRRRIDVDRRDALRRAERDRPARGRSRRARRSSIHGDEVTRPRTDVEEDLDSPAKLATAGGTPRPKPAGMPNGSLDRRSDCPPILRAAWLFQSSTPENRHRQRSAHDARDFYYLFLRFGGQGPSRQSSSRISTLNAAFAAAYLVTGRRRERASRIVLRRVLLQRPDDEHHRLRRDVPARPTRPTRS